MLSHKDHYRLEPRPLGRGGHAIVWKGTHRITGEFHAVKVMENPDNPEACRRFKREIEVLDRVKHENVVPMLHADAACKWYSMPIAAQCLDDVPRPLSDAEMYSIAVQIIDGLSAAHMLGYVHRDVGPRNVLQLVFGGQTRWVVSDFGVARNPPGMTTHILGASRTGLGTMSFSAPEVWEGDCHDADARADVYSFGRLLAHCTSPKTVKLRQNVQYIPSGVWAELIRECTADSPEDRPKTVREVARRLRDLEESILPSRPIDLIALLLSSNLVEDFRSSGGALWCHLPFPPSFFQIPSGWFWAAHHGACGRPGFYTKCRSTVHVALEPLVNAFMVQDESLAFQIASGLRRQ